MALYLLANSAGPTTAASGTVTTGTSIKTMLQFEPSATIGATIVEWGFSLDAPGGVSTIKVELIETDVAATVTAMALADICKLDAAAIAGGDPTTNLIQVGTANTGFTSTSEGSTTATRRQDGPKVITTTSGFVYEKQFPLGNEPFCQVSKFTRIRVTATVAMNMYCYLIVRI